jgi:general secretion pathway protein A
MSQMYNQFFGFKERPFQLVPNPAYFFLSRSHEEAMAHLIYAVSQGDGFVEITGEVGTGKTTLCRAFLENLGPETEVAYVFNPKLDSIQLLKAINDEFGISAEANNAKELIDNLNVFLLRKKAEGKQVIAVIDEAQNLSYDVLEQLRLLSNLETSTSKLLQIILVGQPELAEMLDSHDLRQIAQRITLSCHLSPLSYKEAGAYIRHRLHVACQKPGVTFTRSALRAIHKYSGGIPRLVNIACDRALLTGFGLNKTKITGRIAKASIRELAGRGNLKRFGLQVGGRNTYLVVSSIALFIALLYVVSLGIILYGPGDLAYRKMLGPVETEKPKVTQKVPSFGKLQEKSASEAAFIKKGDIPPKKSENGLVGQEGLQKDSPPPPSELKNTEVGMQLGDVLKEIDSRSSRTSALKAALRVWYEHPDVSPWLQSVEDDQAFFRLGAKQSGLQIQRIEGDISLVSELKHPAILAFRVPGGVGPRYLALTRIDRERMVLSGGGKGGTVAVDLDQIRPYWSRVAYMVWRDFLNYPGAISSNAPGEPVVALKLLLHDIGYSEIEMNPFYDSRTIETVKKIQEEHGLNADGIVGPLTKMVLYSEKPSLNVPHIMD